MYFTINWIKLKGGNEMEERRFILKEFDKDGSLSTNMRDGIPLSELKRRIDYIRSTASDWMEYEDLINVLLHKEGEMTPEGINRIIAEKVMGWPNQHHTTLAVANFDPYHRIEQAMMALEKFPEWHIFKDINGDFNCFIYNDKKAIGSAWADTPEAAITLALVEAAKGGL